MRRTMTAVLVTLASVAGCGGEIDHEAEACESLAAADQSMTDGDADSAGSSLDEAVDHAVASGDQQLADAGQALRREARGSGSTGFIEAMLDMNERCGELGLRRLRRAGGGDQSGGESQRQRFAFDLGDRDEALRGRGHVQRLMRAAGVVVIGHPTVQGRLHVLEAGHPFALRSAEFGS